MRRFVVLLLLAVAIVPNLSAVAEVAAPLCLEHSPGSAQAPTNCASRGSVTEIGFGTFEPTLGATADGALYYSTTDGAGVAIGFKAGVARSADGGATWTDVTPRIAGQAIPPETNDPYVYVDPTTGRIFAFHMEPILVCSMLSWSDDGGATWTTSPYGCAPTGVWDHQTMVAATPIDTPLTSDYPNVLVQCVNAVYAAMCARSLDGGLTWASGVPAYVNENMASLCGAQHGHLVAAPDGTVYLPTSNCGEYPALYVSHDSGLSWERSQVAAMDMPFDDPAVAVDENGTVYVSFIDETGQLWLSVSTDEGGSWSTPVKAAPTTVTATKPAMVVGDPGHVAIAYPGTTGLPDRFATDRQADDFDASLLEWGGYLTVSTDALGGAPTFQTVNTGGDDPLMRGYACQAGGRCSYQVDFIDVTITPDGRPIAALVDGCTGACATTDGVANNERGAVGRGVIVTITTGPDLCATTCAAFAPAGTAR